MHCTNINHQQIQDWAKEFGKSPEYIGAIVSLWQEQNNNLEDFPSKLWMENQLSDNTTDIKPGVQELFDSNPELANAVYEALGFKQFKFEHLSKYSNLSDFTLNKKEEAVNFLQSLDGKKLFSPSEMLSRISNADTSRINKGLSDYLNSILEQYQGIYAEELINPYRIEFKEQLKLGDDRDDTIGDLRGYNQAGYKAINLTNIESNDLIKTILHEFVHDIEPYVLFKESKLIRFTKTKGSNTPLTEEQLKIGNQLENLRKLVIKHLAEEFKNKKPDSLKNEIERLENGGLITIYGELKKPTLVYINNLKNELNAVNRLIETNKVEEFIENNKQFFLNNEYNHYGVTNLNEFITEALTNDKFRKLLNEIPYKNTTILSYLFELFQKILGIKKDTVLSEALNLIHEVATTKRGQLRDFQITPQQKQQAISKFQEYVDATGKQDIEGFKEFTQGKQFQKLTANEKAKTIEQVTREHRSIAALKDLAHKLAHRIGGKVKFENKTDADWKGYNQGNTSVLNEAYMTPDTPFHEILAHPIIRAIKNKNDKKAYYEIESQTDKYVIVKNQQGGSKVFNTLQEANTFIARENTTTLYQSLIKELETGRGKEVFEQVKRDYQYKKEIPYYTETISEGVGVYYNPQTKTGYEVDHSNGKKLQYFRNEQEVRDYLKINDKYTLEEQQEEAIVTLLGMMAADKLDVKKDATLISKLKELWKQISDFVRQLLLQDGIKIDELPITTTLNDLAEIMAYGNNKIILPGYKVEYDTPLGNKYDTLEEVTQEIRGLADANVEVDLSNVSIKLKANSITDVPNTFNLQAEGDYVFKENGIWYRTAPLMGFNKENLFEFSDSDIVEMYNSSLIYTQAEGVNNFIEKNKEYEQSKEIIEQWKKENNIQYDPEEVYSRGQGFYSSIGAYSNLELDLLLKNLIQHIQDNKKAGGEFTISAFTKPIDTRLKHIEGTGDRVRFVIYPKSNHIKWAAPTDVYSGSVWDAHEKVSKDKKSELLGVSFTKAPALRNINEVSPNLADIIDNLSHAHNELGIELTTDNFRLEYDEDIPYTTKKIIDSVNSILDQKYGKLKKPEISQPKTEKITLYRVKGEPEYFNTKEEAQQLANKLSQIDFMSIYVVESVQIDKVSKQTGIQPAQTKQNTTSIESVLNSYNKNNRYVLSNDIGYVAKDDLGNITDVFDDIKKAENQVELWQETNPDDGWRVEKINKPKEKEYTSQAEINLKIAALKEVAKKYPRSLIRSEVVPINPNMVDNSEIQYSKKQGYNPKTITDEYGNTWNGIKDDTFKENDWSEEVNTLVTQQYEQVNPTFEQKRNVEKLMSFSSDLSGSTKENYILKNNTVINRVSKVIKEDEKFKFNKEDFDESKYDINKIWGNQIDDILRAVIQFRFDDNQMQNVLSVIEKLRNKRGEESQINEEITQKLIYEFNNFLKQNPTKIAIPQVFLYNEEEKIGDTADLILVDEFGNSEIIDLKSSVNPTKFNGRYFEDYTKVDESGEEYTNRYDKAFQNDRGSKKERHEAQLSMDAGMLESRAIPLKGTTILPIHIAETVGDTVTKVNVEKHFPLLLNTTYLNKTNIDSKHNFRIANTYETEFDQNVNKVVLAIKNEIALLKHIKTENTTYSIKDLERMLKVLENKEFVSASKLALYVSDLHKTFITGEHNLQSKLNGLVSEIKNEKLTDNREIIQKLLSYKKKVEHFRPLIEGRNGLIEFYDEVGKDNNDPESILGKLKDIKNTLAHIDSLYERTILPFMAENFYQFTDSEEFTKELEKKFDKIQKKIDEYQLKLSEINKKTAGLGNNRSKKLEGYINNLKDDLKIGRRTLQTSKEDILTQLKKGSYEDISWFQMWALAPQDAPNVFIAGASQIIDNNDNELRQKQIELQEEFLPAYKEFIQSRQHLKDKPKELNDGLYEIITLGYFDPVSKEFIERQEVAYVQKTDITKFNKEKKEFQESIKDIEDRNEYWKKLNDWYSLNTKPISANDEVVNGVVIKQGYLSVIKDKMKDKENHLISEKQFNDWKMSAFKIDKYGNIVEVRNDTKEGKELREPNDKYINDKWLAIQNGGDVAKLNFYNMLISQAHKSRQLLPQNLSQEEKYILPYNNKIGLEKAQDGIKGFAKDKWDRAFNEVGSDKKMQYGETTESGLKVIPTMYTSKIPIEDVSLDLAQSTLLFAKEALQYEARVKLEPLMTALQIAITTNKPKKTDSKGKLVLKKFAEELNLPGLDAYVDSSESNLEAFFKYYIDHAIYGISREKSMANIPILGETDLHSVVDTISAVIANTSMGLPFGLFSNVANYLQGEAQTMIEAHAQQFTDKATLAWANKEYLSFSNDFVKDVVDAVPETFIGQLIEIIDPFIGEFKDKFGRKISKSKARILMNSSPLMFLQSLGEHSVQIKMMLAVLKSTKLKDEQGLDTNLYDVYKNSWNPTTKKIEIKSNILSQLGSTTSNGLLSNSVKNKLNYILQSTHGNYAKMTAPMANKFWYSRVIKFMRNFFANSVAKRWRGERKNYRLMDITEGYQRTFFRLMREEFSEMVKVGFGFHTSKEGVFNSLLKTDTSTLTPRELANLRRNAMDMAFILSTSLIIMLLTWMLKNAGDDDEKQKIMIILAPVMRLNAELSAFGQIGNPQKGLGFLPDIGDIKRNLSNPTVMYGYITKTVSFIEQIPKDITNLAIEGDVQRYEKATGYYEKGDSKFWAKFVKLFGASPSKMDLGESIKALNMQQNK